MEIHERKAVSDELKKYDHLAKDSDFIEVTEWGKWRRLGYLFK